MRLTEPEWICYPLNAVNLHFMSLNHIFHSAFSRIGSALRITAIGVVIVTKDGTVLLLAVDFCSSQWTQLKADLEEGVMLS